MELSQGSSEENDPQFLNEQEDQEAIEQVRQAELESIAASERQGVGVQEQQMFTREEVEEIVRQNLARAQQQTQQGARQQGQRLRSPPPSRYAVPSPTSPHPGSSISPPIVTQVTQGATQGQQMPLAAAGIMVSPWQGEIDLTTKQGKALWDEGIRSAETKFTGQGKDLYRFLADVANRINKCYWHDIMRVNGKELLTQHGEITIEEVKRARNTRQLIVPRTLAEAKPLISAQMLYYFIYESLGPMPQKKVSTKLGTILQDGPTLFKIVVDDTFIGTKASTFLIMNQIYSLQPKAFKWSIKVLNMSVREKLASLEATGNRPSDDTHVILALFRAYKECSSQTWLLHLAIWEDQWTEGRWNKAEDLMEKGDKKYDELISSKNWGRKDPKNDQVVALAAGSNKQGGSRTQASSRDPNDRKSTTAKWKFDRSQSQSKTLNRNQKEYKWCTGPGHNGIAMWVRHEPGSCTADRSNKPREGQQKAGFTAETISSALKDKGLSDTEVQSKVEAIIGVIES